MTNVKFYICPHCGNILEMIHDAGPKPFCCGRKMEALIPGSMDASLEKHVPQVQVAGNRVEVCVGSVNHPMEEAHRIDWVQLVTDRGSYRKGLNPGDVPSVTFLTEGETPLAVYAYCNLHGLWVQEI